jgi:serine/threonine protein kinase
VAYIHD